MSYTAPRDFVIQIPQHENYEEYAVERESKGTQTVKVIKPDNPSNTKDKFKSHACEVAKIAIPTLLLMGTLYLLTNYAVDEMKGYFDQEINSLNPQYQSLISSKMDEATTTTIQ